MASRRVTLALTLALLAAAPAAHAATWRHVEQAVLVGEAVYPPLCSPVVVHVEPIPPGLEAAADPTLCAVYLPPDVWHWTWDLLCSDVVHEVGHLAGLPHSTNPASPMFPGATSRNTPLACYRHFAWHRWRAW